MNNLNTIEMKAFVPSKDYTLSKQFYQDLGFEMCSDNNGVAYFSFGKTSFLLQDFYNKTHTENFMMHILVEDIDAWFSHVTDSKITEKYDSHLSSMTTEPCGMRDFCLTDPSGVLWRFGQNIN